MIQIGRFDGGYCWWVNSGLWRRALQLSAGLPPLLALFGEFVLTSRTKLSDLGMVYNFPVPPYMANWSIARYIFSKYRQPVVGQRVALEQVEFAVLAMKHKRLIKVSLKLHK